MAVVDDTKDALERQVDAIDRLRRQRRRPQAPARIDAELVERLNDIVVYLQRTDEHWDMNKRTFVEEALKKEIRSWVKKLGLKEVPMRRRPPRQGRPIK